MALSEINKLNVTQGRAACLLPVPQATRSVLQDGAAASFTSHKMRFGFNLRCRHITHGNKFPEIPKQTQEHNSKYPRNWSVKMLIHRVCLTLRTAGMFTPQNYWRHTRLTRSTFHDD